MVELFWLLLPVAAFSGWVIGRRGRRASGSSPSDGLQDAYFQGLNYLLNEQPDKAIEVFIKVLEVDTETVELHLALGNLFGRRGEIERATRIHQNLIARASLSPQQRAQALYQLGQDYQRAGLLDRAESLFGELAEGSLYAEPALRNLLQIYEQEKEWQQAIAVAERLVHEFGRDMDGVLAQYWCELAETALGDESDVTAAGEADQARRHIARALEADPRCVRATLLKARIEAGAGRHREAIRVLSTVEQQDPLYLGEAVEPIARSYRALEDEAGLLSYLREALDRHGGVHLMLALVDVAERQQGSRQAEQLLVDWLRRDPSMHGLLRLVELKLTYADPGQRRDLKALHSMIFTILEREQPYACRQCGFSCRALYWHCPSCRGWVTIRPTLAAQ